MPHFFNNTVVVTKEELVPSWFKTQLNLSVTIGRYKDKPYGIKRIQLGGNGRQMLISYDSLPKEIQDGLGDPRKCDHILERFYKTDGGAVNYFTTYKFGDGTYMEQEYQERYITNASVLKAIIELRSARQSERKSKGGSLAGIGATLAADAHSFQPTLLARFKVQHTLPQNYRVFLEVLHKFESAGYESLISGKHKNQNTRKVTDETLALLNSLFVSDRQKPTATEVHRRYDGFLSGYNTVINNETGECYDPKAFKKLSDATVKNYMAQWNNKIGTYALRGGDRQKLMQQFKPYHSLEKPKYAGSIISIDDRQPPFKTPNGKRVWFYNGIDLASEAFTASVWGDTKEGIILEFYRAMLRNYTIWGINIPNELECEMSLNGSFKDTFLRPGAMFQEVRIEANNARGKRIERYFGSLRYGLEKMREGWLARPFAMSESNQAGPKEIPALPYRTIVENGLRDIQEWNNQPHSIHTHMSRWQVFCEMQHPDLKPTNFIAILPHIGFKTETSCRVGLIKLQHKEYVLGMDGKIALGDRLIHLMKQVEGKNVQIYWIDDHEGRVLKALVFIDGLHICEAIPKPTYNRATIEQGPDDHAMRQLMSAYVATIESYGRRRKNSMEQVTIIDERPAPFKHFVMPGLKQDILEDRPQSGGLLPDPDDFEEAPMRSFVVPLKDRF